MNKLNELLAQLKTNASELAFIFFSIRLIILGASIGDAIALLSLSGLLGYKYLLAKKQASQLENLQQDVEHLKNSLSAVRITQSMISNKGKLPNESTPVQQKRFV